MGPRPRGRGDALAKSVTELDAIALQWVHGRAAVVMKESSTLSRRVITASMGPRPRGRGDVGTGVAWVTSEREGASMGPRPRGRGDGNYVLCAPAKPSSFNGSTAARPW